MCDDREVGGLWGFGRCVTAHVNRIEEGKW